MSIVDLQERIVNKLFITNTVYIIHSFGFVNPNGRSCWSTQEVFLNDDQPKDILGLIAFFPERAYSYPKA